MHPVPVTRAPSPRRPVPQPPACPERHMGEGHETQTQTGAALSPLWANPALSWALVTARPAAGRGRGDRQSESRQGKDGRAQEAGQGERAAGASSQPPFHGVCLNSTGHTGSGPNLCVLAARLRGPSEPVWVLTPLPLRQPEPRFPSSACLSCLPPRVN